MSLVGSLEDLSLGDILQIISLSQKSGVLALKTTGCAGRIVFVNGLVRGAGIKGGPQDLRGVLVDGGFLSDDEFVAAVEHADEGGGGVAAALSEISSLTPERVDSLCREAIESAVVEMFSWHTGDFSFDVRSETEPDDPELLLPTGINAQYLAMEAARVKDEDGLKGESDSDAIDEMSAHDFFGVSEESESADEDAVETLAMTTAQRSDAHGSLDEGDLIQPDPLPAAPADAATPLDAVLDVDDVSDAEILPESDEARSVAEAKDIFLAAEPMAESETLDLDAREPIEDAETGRDTAPASPSTPPAPVDAPDQRPLVALEDDLHALEWVKGAVKQDFAPIHIFQQTDQALARVRQYLVRGQPPVILISPHVQVDCLGGIRDTVDFVARLKSQSAKVTVLWLCEESSGGISRLGAADGVVTRPDSSRLRGRKSSDELEQLASLFAQKLRIDVEAASLSDASSSPTSPKLISPDAIRKLRDATRALTEASSRGEVLPLVIRFAAEVFERVAMFMVRDGRVVGMAGHGLDRAGGPDDAGLREISIDPGQSLWMRTVLEHGKPIQGSADSAGDRMLVALLGDRSPPSAYVAPIESTGQVIAVLYGDNLPAEEPLGDTSALEVVLHHAGMALDRAALERALREDAG